MDKPLQGKTVAILVAHGFEQSEFTEPKRALEEAGARAVVVSPKEGVVCGWNEQDWGDEFPVDLPLAEADVEAFDALLLPGGVMNPDHLRRDRRAVDLVAAFAASGRPIAAICHGPWLLAEAGIARGRRLTSFHSIRTDLVNAGADWRDEEVVVDQGLVTSRSPADIPAFNRRMIEEIAEGRHAPRAPRERETVR